MRHPKKELNFDTIGGLGPLTKEDEKAISDFLQARKLKNAKGKTRLSSRNKTRNTVRAKA